MDVLIGFLFFNGMIVLFASNAFIQLVCKSLFFVNSMCRDGLGGYLLILKRLQLCIHRLYFLLKRADMAFCIPELESETERKKTYRGNQATQPFNSHGKRQGSR